MAGTVEKKLAELGIVLPTPATPVANYIPFVQVGALSSPIGRGHASRPPVSARARSWPCLVARG